MKSVIAALVLLCLAATAFAADQAKLDDRIRKLTDKFQTLQLNPEKCVPAETLRKARGLILLDRTKAGFIFGFQGGGGVAMVKDPKTEQWGPLAFVNASEASLGAQIGVQKSFFVILFMTPNATRLLTAPGFEFGGEAQGTADTVSGGVEGTVTSHERVMLVYSDRKGLYGGAVLKGGALSPETDANLAYYGDVLTMQDILFENQVKPTAAAIDLAKAINGSRATRVATRPRPSLPPYAGKMRPAEPVSRMARGLAPAASTAALAEAPAVNAPANSAVAELSLLLAELEASRQTNAVMHLHNYLSGMTLSMQNADAATTLFILEQLRAGHTTAAMELLESRLDAAVIGLGATLRQAPKTQRDSNSLQTLQRARQYRAEHPRKTANTNVDNAVMQTWKLLSKAQ